MPRVTFQPMNVPVDVEPGANLLKTAMDAGIHINASCGGQGVCAKCRVKIAAGEVEGGVSERLADADIKAGYRLACKTQVIGDVTIEIPLESQVDSKVLNKKKPKLTLGQKRDGIGVRWITEEGLAAPWVQCRYLELEAPSFGSNFSDLGRVCQALGPECDNAEPDVDFELIGRLPDILREDDFKITISMARHPNNGPGTIINAVPGNRAAEHYGLAFDLGTTTVYGQLLDLNTSEVVAEYGAYNNQISYGEDVLTRIMYAIKGDGLKVLQSKVVDNINDISERLIKKAGIDRSRVSQLVAAGNTTMTQLFLGINPKHIRLSPFVPTASFYPPVRAVDMGINLDRHARLQVFPSISSYVGGDIVAGVLASGLYRESPLTLFIDIGTNGEIVVGNQEWMACAACSAGPAFEGGGVEHGMRAADGAIEDFSIHPETCEPMIVTIGLTKPRGICGTGLINIVATLFEMGLIDSRGKFRTDLPTDRIRQGESGGEFVVAYADQTAIDRDIVITEVDIDNLIRAKGAMFAGYMTLLESVGLSMADLDRVIIGGGFGQYINLDRAITIGLLPEMPPDRFSFIGNSSLMGARMLSISNPMRKEIQRIVTNMTNFELSEVPHYMDYYVGALFLPHTDQQTFPGVMSQIAEMHGLLENICVNRRKSAS